MQICQQTMDDNGSFNGVVYYWECGKPAKAWVPDPWKRKSYNHKLLLCGLHARCFDKRAARFGRKTSVPL